MRTIAACPAARRTRAPPRALAACRRSSPNARCAPCRAAPARPTVTARAHLNAYVKVKYVSYNQNVEYGDRVQVGLRTE